MLKQIGKALLASQVYCLSICQESLNPAPTTFVATAQYNQNLNSIETIINDATTRLNLFQGREIEGRNLDYLDTKPTGNETTGWVQLVQPKDGQLVRFKSVDSIPLIHTSLQQLFFVMYQILRSHIETAQYASDLGSNFELQHRWLQIQTDAASQGDQSNNQLQQSISSFHDNHAKMTTSRLINSHLLDFESVNQFRKHDFTLAAVNGLLS